MGQKVIKDCSCMANSSDDFRWLNVLGSTPQWRDIHDEILQHVKVETVVTEELWRTRPAEMAAWLSKYPILGMDHMRAHPLLIPMKQEFRISRARKTPFRWGRLLTITLSESVDRARLNTNISASDQDQLCARLQHTETWSGVLKIRLREDRRLNDFGEEVGYPFYVFELVRRGHDGAEHIVAPSRRFALKARMKRRLLQDLLMEELGLKRAVVDGVTEFWC